ncbi:MAG: hypothetical protein M3081_16175 [Gemmatimonadota bacterium]|nr:hypothetical protein [Gemmatimonadota bacterium]
MRDDRDDEYMKFQTALETQLERHCADVTFAAQHLDAEFEHSVREFARGIRDAGATSDQTVELLEQCLARSRVAQLDAADSLWIYERVREWALGVF